MKKEIKDYLHLYYSCECDLTKEDNFHFPHTVKLDAALMGNAITMPDVYIVKPILRPLSDMTGEEKAEYYAIKANTESPAAYIHAAGTLFLLSIGIDLFSLIESGLAINQSTIKQ